MKFLIGFELNKMGLLLVVLPACYLLSITIIICMILLETTVISYFLAEWLNRIRSSETIYLILHYFIISLSHIALITYASLLASILRTYYSTVVVESVLLTHEVWVVLKCLYFQFIFNLRSTHHCWFQLVLWLLIASHVFLLSEILLFLKQTCFIVLKI